MSKNKKRAKPGRAATGPGKTAAEIAVGIRVQLRTIVRRLNDLRRPFSDFQEITGLPEGHPRYLVRQASCYETFQEEILVLVGAIWHLKDRLKLWVAAKRHRLTPKDIEDLATKSKALLICADLINENKHGESRNRSGYEPRLDGLSLDLSKNGPFAMKYDGALKEGEHLVAEPTPIPFTVEIITGDGRGTFGNAVDLLEAAFAHWRQVIWELGILTEVDPESRRLQQLLYPPSGIPLAGS